MLSGEHRLFVAGDALIAQPWSHIDDPSFTRLIAEMRNAQTTILNLETLLHDYRGYAQADSGGTYMASPPPIAGELRWAGVNMVSHANNHAFDYGAEGILDTHEHVGAAGIVVAGTGRDLQSARAPQYCVTNGGTVALVSMASTFVPYGVASPARPDLHGRPGLNPLRLTKGTLITVTRKQTQMLRRMAERLGRFPDKYLQPEFRLLGVRFRVGDGTRIDFGSRISPPDRLGNLASIEQAARNADATVVAIHAHLQGEWLRRFCHAAISKGADVVVMHGPHEIRGIEIHAGKPLFFGMGDFVYQTDQISRLPAEAYENVSLDNSATIEEFHGDGKRFAMQRTRSVYEAFAATLDYANGALTRIRLLPVDLQFDAAYLTRGRPQYATPELGRKIITQVARLSRKFGTKIRYDSDLNEGVVELS